MSPFRVAVERHPVAAVLRVEGDVDLATVEGLRVPLAEAIDEGQPAVVVDLTRVTFLGSPGFEVIVIAHRDLEVRGGRLVLANPQGIVARALDTAGMVNLVDVYDSVDLALTALL